MTLSLLPTKGTGVGRLSASFLRISLSSPAAPTPWTTHSNVVACAEYPMFGSELMRRNDCAQGEKTGKSKELNS